MEDLKLLEEVLRDLDNDVKDFMKYEEEERKRVDEIEEKINSLQIEVDELNESIRDTQQSRRRCLLEKHAIEVYLKQAKESKP